MVIDILCMQSGNLPTAFDIHNNNLMTCAIKVENLGKKYTIKHQQQSRYQYNSLGESLSRGFRSLGKNLLHPFHSGTSFENTEEFWALKDINFEIEHGDRVGIIGRNGAGKSTLLKILSRITHPSTGKVTLNGRVSSLLEVGTGFHPELTGRENIFLNGAILGMRKQEIRSKFDEIVGFAEVDKFLDTPVKHYSSGMYVRLAFAVAAHLEPEILIVDEVLAVGDAQFQKKCLGKMEEVSKTGRTVLFVSHNIPAIKELCNSAILLNFGKKEIEDNVDIVINKYICSLEQKRSVFEMLVAPNANLLSVRICDSEGNTKDNIDTDTDVYFNMTYEIKKAGRINLVLNLSKDGYFVFQSINNHDNFYEKVKQKGVYRSTCHLPRQYLNSGSYVLSITIFEENYSNPTEFRDIMSFHVEDAPSVRGDYFGGLLGCTRPLLNWNTSVIK